MKPITFTLNQLVERFGGKVVGDGSLCIRSLAPLESAGPEQLSFLTNLKYLAQVESTRAAAVLITDTDRLKIKSQQMTFLVTSNPYAYFARVAQLFVVEPPIPARIHPTAVIHSTAQVAESASIGPYAVVEASAVIGEQVRLDAHVFVGRETVIADHAHLFTKVTVYHGCQIGERTIIHAGTVIGADGFGFAPDFEVEVGEWVKIPQMGGVVIGAEVEIGANSTIDRSTMANTNTIIENGVKIDNLVQIGHNCHIGAYTVICGCSGIAGSTTIGRHCMIGGAVGIAGHVRLGDHVVITGKSGVSKSLLKAGTYTSAFPAIDHAQWNRHAALMHNLDKMRARLKRLESVCDPIVRAINPNP